MRDPDSFKAELFRVDGGNWMFVAIPEEYAPDGTVAWGRCPVLATVDDSTWATSAWKDKAHGWLLPVPRKLRKDKTAGDIVTVALREDPARPWPR